MNHNSGNLRSRSFIRHHRKLYILLRSQRQSAQSSSKKSPILGVNSAVSAVNQIRQNQGKLGVFWHTQGSGKSYSMVFFSQKVLRKLLGNWTFLIITDREDLDAQIYKNFAYAGAVTEPEKEVRANNAEHLKQMLQNFEQSPRLSSVGCSAGTFKCRQASP